MTGTWTSLSRQNPDTHLRGRDKLSRIPVKVEVSTEPMLRKPEWLRIRWQPSARVQDIKKTLRQHRLHTVCEEAACPNLGECFGRGTATFMIMGDICTRRCPFCDVAHGRPQPLDADEPNNLAAVVADMGLSYVVITSVDRDDLRDGGAAHFATCIDRVRAAVDGIRVEILVPDFRGRMDKALACFDGHAPDVFNHNLETVPRLYLKARPGSDYDWSLDLLEKFTATHPQVPTKSGLMLGLGEETSEIIEVMRDLRAHGCSMLTLGQYLQPSRDHLPVDRYVHPDEFNELGEIAKEMGFSGVASGPLVRSSYFADAQLDSTLDARQNTVAPA
ncbi:MAG: lipoyl synthase [Gammaproteobacteria bacterium]|nr:lipoyl synthase [Pseudomonadota bacterium]MCH9662412.1 lipoyl synthase [Gammaproteobacteria bacterium]